MILEFRVAEETKKPISALKQARLNSLASQNFRQYCEEDHYLIFDEVNKRNRIISHGLIVTNNCVILRSRNKIDTIALIVGTDNLNSTEESVVLPAAILEIEVPAPDFFVSVGLDLEKSLIKIFGYCKRDVLIQEAKPVTSQKAQLSMDGHKLNPDINALLYWIDVCNRN